MAEQISKKQHTHEVGNMTEADSMTGASPVTTIHEKQNPRSKAAEDNIVVTGLAPVMPPTPATPPTPVIPHIVLFIAIAIVYLLVVLSQVTIHPPGMGRGAHFILLADGWLHGHLYVQGTPPDLSDFTYFKGHWYVAFPPLPAILLLPLVTIFHLSYQSIITLAFSVGMGILNIWLMQQVLLRLVRKGLLSGHFATVAWLLVFFALGTELLYTTMKGSVWFTAHVVATTFLLLYIMEMLGKQRAWLAALCLGLASLSRSTTLLGFPFFLLWTFTQERKRPLLVLRQWIIFGSVLGVILAGMLLYNYARFGSLLDFGYNTMHVNPLVSSPLHTYGQFSIHFLATNLRFMLLEPPKFMKVFPYVTFNPFGTSIFLTMPALFFAFLAFRKREQRWLATSLLAGCLLPIASVLLYFNTGWYQFGYRFALDFLPFLFLLAALGMAERPRWGEKTLIVLSVLINVWGYIVFTYFRPPPLG
ncbi:MAG: hypothetical protein NVS4B12_05870 [Ktedonobacteraceae bacterium]